MSSMDKTVEEMELVLSKLAEIERLEKQIEETKSSISEDLETLKTNQPEMVAMMAKVPYKGRFYSIKSRYNKSKGRHTSFITSSDVAFGSWHKKNKED